MVSIISAGVSRSSAIPSSCSRCALGARVADHDPHLALGDHRFRERAQVQPDHRAFQPAADVGLDPVAFIVVSVGTHVGALHHLAESVIGWRAAVAGSRPGVAAYPRRTHGGRRAHGTSPRMLSALGFWRVRDRVAAGRAAGMQALNRYMVLLPGSYDPDRGDTARRQQHADPRGRTDWIVFDTGRHEQAFTGRIIAAAEGWRLPVVAIVGSHWHLDYVSGNVPLRERYPRAKVYASTAGSRA